MTIPRDTHHEELLDLFKLYSITRTGNSWKLTDRKAPTIEDQSRNHHEMLVPHQGIYKYNLSALKVIIKRDDTPEDFLRG